MEINSINEYNKLETLLVLGSLLWGLVVLQFVGTLFTILSKVRSIRNPVYARKLQTYVPDEEQSPVLTVTTHPPPRTVSKPVYPSEWKT